MTFDKFNLQVIGYGFCGIQENNGWMELLIELALTPGEKLTEDIAIKANFYDEDSTIIFSNDNTFIKLFLNHFFINTCHIFLSPFRLLIINNYLYKIILSYNLQ